MVAAGREAVWSQGRPAVFTDRKTCRPSTCNPEVRRVRLFCVDGPERADGFCDQHGKSYLIRRRRGGGGGGSTGGTIPSP